MMGPSRFKTGLLPKLERLRSMGFPSIDLRVGR